MARRSVVALILASGVATACAVVTDVTERPPTQPTASPSPVTTVIPTLDDSARQPSFQTFGPTYGVGPAPGTGTTIDIGVVLNSDRRSVDLSFTGAPGYLSEDWCSEDYWGWAGVADDVLEIGVGTRHHEEQAPPPPNGACNLDGHGHSMHLALAEPFSGSVIRDLAIGEIPFPLPEQLADLAAPVGWSVTGVNTFMDPGTVFRRWTPNDADPTRPVVQIVLVQVMDGPARTFAVSNPLGSMTINGVAVPINREAEADTLWATWSLGDSGLTLQTVGGALDIAAFGELAKSVRVREP